jgi:uncharacterized protein YdhG (YjbR/CyaY superfamily)
MMPEASPSKEPALASFATVDEYLASLPDEKRAVLEELRRAVNAAAPGTTETIAYDMPALRSKDGRFLLSYGGYKNHYSLFPASEVVVAALGDELTPYLAGRGTIRFPASRPIPLAMVTKIVEVRVAEHTADRGR